MRKLIMQGSRTTGWSSQQQPALAILVVFGVRGRQILYSSRQNAAATNSIQPWLCSQTSPFADPRKELCTQQNGGLFSLLIRKIWLNTVVAA